MLAYYTAREHFGDVRLVDRYGLVDRTFTDCPVTANTMRTLLGLGLHYQTYFELRETIEESCGFASPDLIVDRPALARDVAAQDYTIVHLPRRLLSIDSRWFPGDVGIADSVFIAVRDDLVSAAGGVGAFARGMDSEERDRLRDRSTRAATPDEPPGGGLP